MRIRKLIKKLLLTSIVVVEVALINVPGAFALSVSSIAEDLEERYHLNLRSIQDQGEAFNVADTKKTPPQVMLFFSPSDPKPGEKLTAEALPTYFSNPKESLYYTWYLKHKECDECDEGDCDSDDLEICDRDNDDDIDENDWKIEAMRIITNGDFDTRKADYSDNSDNDKDGYEANWGGDDREDMPNYCYIHDFENGINYELRENAGADFDCPDGTTAACVEDESLICPSDPSYIDYTVCQEAEEEPTCNTATDLAECSDGTPVCLDSLTEYDCNSPPAGAETASCANTFAETDISCTVSSDSSAGENLCLHLFPEYNNFDGCLDVLGTPGNDSDDVCIDLDDESVGDDDFKEDEEVFWKTSPQDPDTADIGNQDEANAAGLGISAFTWNYQPEDKVGVIIEGASMIPTKHADSSFMIMWAYPKNECEVENKGEYRERIKGYSVRIPTAEMNLNDCIEDNLVDPREGGQPKKINVSLSYSPENPLNDPTEDNMGDVIVASATTDNTSQNDTQLYYEWAVEISPEGTYNPISWTDITGKLLNSGLIPRSIKGNGLSSLKIKLNLNPDNLEVSEATFNDDYFPDGIGYLRVRVMVSENFSSGVSREGKSDVIIKVISTEEKIDAYTAGVNRLGKLTIDESYNPLCQSPGTGEQTPLCFILKNEIVGVKIDNADEELENFSWTLNGNSLNCNSLISDSCSDEKQVNYNFFPVTGNIGDTYTVGLTANNVTTGKTINLVRTFQIIDPFVKIVSTDQQSCWPKHLGTYIDLDGNQFSDFSESVYQTLMGNNVALKAEFHPAWLVDHITDGLLQLEWIVDGIKQDSFNNVAELSLSSSDKELGSVYNISVNSAFRHPAEIRQALKNIWGVSQFDTTEEYMSHDIQIEVFAPENETLTLKNSGKFLAGLLSYLPSQITFLLRILLTIIIIIVTAGVVFAFTPEFSYENKKTIF